MIFLWKTILNLLVVRDEKFGQTYRVERVDFIFSSVTGSFSPMGRLFNLTILLFSIFRMGNNDRDKLTGVLLHNFELLG